MSINERFETIIKVLFAGNKRAFAKAVGISPTVVENVVGARKGKPSYDVLVKVCANANISAEWLLMGTGELVMDMFSIRKDLVLEAPADPENEIGQSFTTTFKKGTKIPAKEISDGGQAALIAHLDAKLNEKEREIGTLHENIGRLKERITQLEQEKNASEESYQKSLKQLSESPVD